MSVTVTVCLCTYKRKHLYKTLKSLSSQNLPDNVQLEVSVIDNDIEGSGRLYVDKIKKETDIIVNYSIEPRKNISLARNASVEQASKSSDWLAFIDDDETADVNWVKSLLVCAADYNAEVVVGRVETYYPEEAPVWISQGDYFGKTLPETGVELNVGATCNALVKYCCLKGKEGPFDEQLGVTGGEDTDLFQRLHGAGCLIVACQDAIVSETVESHRLNSQFLIKKAVRVGETYGSIFFDSLPLLPYSYQFIKALLQASMALMLVALCLPFGKAQYFKFVIKMMSNWGKIRYFTNQPPIEIYKG